MIDDRDGYDDGDDGDDDDDDEDDDDDDDDERRFRFASGQAFKFSPQIVLRSEAEQHRISLVKKTMTMCRNDVSWQCNDNKVNKVKNQWQWPKENDEGYEINDQVASNDYDE